MMAVRLLQAGPFLESFPAGFPLLICRMPPPLRSPERVSDPVRSFRRLTTWSTGVWDGTLLGGWLQFASSAAQPASRAAVERETSEWYRRYYESKGDDRSDPLRNPGVLFQNLAFQKSVVESLRAISIQKDWRILDVGCGGGFSLLQLATFGLDPAQLHGIDLLPDRIALGKRRFPSLQLSVGDAQALDIEDSTFDFVTESTMFIQLTDDALASRIASEMVRVTRSGGFLMLTDWRYSFGRAGYRALSRRRVRELFQVGTQTRLIHRTQGALLPPIGRFLSRYAPSIYFLIARVFPPLVGQVTYLLEKL